MPHQEFSFLLCKMRMLGLVFSKAPCRSHSVIPGRFSWCIRYFLGASICFERCIYLPRFYLTSCCSHTPDGALKSSHSFSTPSVYSKRIASGSKDLVQLMTLSDTKHKEELIFLKAGTWDLSFSLKVHISILNFIFLASF